MKIEMTCVAELAADKDFKGMCDEYATYSIKRLKPPTFDQAMYEAIERMGSLTVYRAMVGTELAGFMSIVTSKLPKYMVQSSVVEGLFVRAIHRKHGSGIKLIEVAEKFYLNVGSKALIINCPYAETILQELLLRRGYTPETVSYMLTP